MKTYKEQCRETGEVFEKGLTFERAEETLQAFLLDDMLDCEVGDYDPDFYEIREEE